VKKPGRLLAVICLAGLLVGPGADGSGFPKPPKSAATRKELVQHFGTTIGFGEVVKWEFTTAGHAYYRSRAQQAWVLFIDRVIEPAIKLSAEISSDDHLLVLKDMEGKVVEKQSIRSLPR
jgi:hypothetical protein